MIVGLRIADFGLRILGTEIRAAMIYDSQLCDLFAAKVWSLLKLYFGNLRRGVRPSQAHPLA